MRQVAATFRSILDDSSQSIVKAVRNNGAPTESWDVLQPGREKRRRRFCSTLRKRAQSFLKADGHEQSGRRGTGGHSAPLDSRSMIPRETRAGAGASAYGCDEGVTLFCLRLQPVADGLHRRRGECFVDCGIFAWSAGVTVLKQMIQFRKLTGFQVIVAAILESFL